MFLYIKYICKKNSLELRTVNYRHLCGATTTALSTLPTFHFHISTSDEQAKTSSKGTSEEEKGHKWLLSPLARALPSIFKNPALGECRPIYFFAYTEVNENSVLLFAAETWFLSRFVQSLIYINVISSPHSIPILLRPISFPVNNSGNNYRPNNCRERFYESLYQLLTTLSWAINSPVSRKTNDKEWRDISTFQ